MSLIDVDHLSPLDLVTQYILEVRGRGHFVTREESTLIQSWLDFAENRPELLILVLEDTLTERMSKAQPTRQKNVSMAAINRSVRKKLEERKSLSQ